MHLRTDSKLRLVALVGVMALLSACATATPFPITGGPQDNAVVHGTPAIDMLGDSAFIEAVDDQPLKASENSVILPPGSHSFSVRCNASVPVSPGSTEFDTYPGKQDITFTVEAGHQYQLMSDPPQDGVGHCIPYMYDSTGGRGRYSETATVVLDGKSFDGSSPHQLYGDDPQGHSRDIVLIEGSFLEAYLVSSIVANKPGHFDDDWQQLAEFNSWTKIMFSQSADDQFKLRVTQLGEDCPDVKVTIVSESTDDVTYEFEGDGKCADVNGHSQMGRYLTGPFAVDQVELISYDPLQDADKTKWAQALHDAKVVSH